MIIETDHHPTDASTAPASPAASTAASAAPRSER